MHHSDVAVDKLTTLAEYNYIHNKQYIIRYFSLMELKCYFQNDPVMCRAVKLSKGKFVMWCY